ncbi:hypothetical protein HOY80DRAFT_1051666 [Tuber brumale]|nr:hypothetical protein HOY80DRAFT_1051666 [Tuber brumale]
MTMDKHLGIWWSMKLLREAPDVLYCGHHDAGKDATLAPANHPFGHPDNRGPLDDPPSGDKSSDDNSPGPSRAQHGSPFVVSDLELNSDMVSDNATNLAIPEESTWTGINDAGKHPLSAIAETNELNCLANPRVSLRKAICPAPMAVAGITAEPEGTNSKVNPCPPASDGPTGLNSPSPLTPDSHDLDLMICELAEVTKSAEHFLTITVGSQLSEPRREVAPAANSASSLATRRYCASRFHLLFQQQVLLSRQQKHIFRASSDSGRPSDNVVNSH